MSFRNTIDPTVGKVRKNAGKVYESTPSQQIIEVVKPQLMRVGGKQRGIESGEAIADTKTALQSRIFIGFSGNSLTSDMGFSKDITTTATVSSTQKKFGSNSLYFSGSQNASFNISVNKSLQNASTFSIICWTYFATFTGSYGGPFASWQSTGGANDQFIYFNNAGGTPTQPTWGVRVSGTNNFYECYANSGTWIVNQWQLNICEYDNTNKKIRLFIDNNLCQETTFVGTPNLGENFGLGGYNVGNNQTLTNMTGYLDEFCILSGNTTQSERDWLWNSGNGNSLV